MQNFQKNVNKYAYAALAGGLVVGFGYYLMREHFRKQFGLLPEDVGSLLPSRITNITNPTYSYRVSEKSAQAAARWDQDIHLVFVRKWNSAWQIFASELSQRKALAKANDESRLQAQMQDELDTLKKENDS